MQTQYCYIFTQESYLWYSRKWPKSKHRSTLGIEVGSEDSRKRTIHRRQVVIYPADYFHKLNCPFILLAYKNLILLHLNGFATSMDQSNDDGLTVGFLLETADAIYRHHTREIPKKIHHDAEEDWNSKICAEMEDEYQNNWGQYEEDFLEADVNDCETYDSWAERMIYEHRKKTSNHSYKVPPAPKVESKSSSGWSAEDQSQFLKNEETKRIAKEAEKSSKLRFQFLSKLRNMVHSEGTIHSTDLPFDCQDQVECICQHILFDVKEVNDVEEKRKAVRELKRLWHPDKFAQKFHQRLAEDIKDPVMKKVNEIAQYLNTYNC